jgi:amino acid adenylation domain-containing protein
MKPPLGTAVQLDGVEGKTRKSGFSGDVLRMPASPQQRRYALFEEAYPESRVWNVAARWSMRGPLNTSVLEDAINAVCARHEALRTCVEFDSGELVQKIFSELTLSIPVRDLRHIPQAQQSEVVDQLATQEAKSPFTLCEGPLARFQLLRLEDEHNVLMVTVHHAVGDGYSLGVISRDMGAYYEAFLNQATPKLAELPVQFADFVVWQKQALEEGALQTQLAYWKRQLRGLVPLRITGDLPTASPQTWNGTIVSGLLPRSITDELVHVSRTYGTTMFSTALAALYVVLGAHSGRQDLAIGTQVAGRHKSEIENAIGVFSNALVLRTRLQRESSFASFVKQVADTVIQATANQDIPFECVLPAVVDCADLAKDRLYFVNFIYQRSFIENIKFADIQLKDLPSRSPGAPYDLNFFMVERPEGWRLSLEYNTHCYSTEMAERLLSQLQGVLEEVVASPGRDCDFETVRGTTLILGKASPQPEEQDEHLLLPASMGQQRYWLLDQLGQKSSSFKMPIRWRLKGQINPQLLERAFNEVIRRNEILRTTLTEVGGQPMQKVAWSLKIQVPLVDLRSMAEQERAVELEHIADGVGDGQFNMSALPLIHATLVRVEDRDYVLCVTVHPIICDGLAVGLVAQEVFQIYDAFVKGLPNPLPEPEMQYGDYAIWQKEFVRSAAVQEQANYWLTQLKDAKPFEVMPDHPRPILQTTNGAFASLQLPTNLTDLVQLVSKKHGNTFFITVFAAFLTLLYRYTRQEDISVGTEVSGRTETEHERIIGLFLNTLVLRADLSGNPTFPELLQRVQDVVMQAIANQDVPFQRIVEIVNPPRDPSRKPLFQVNFMLQRSTVSNHDYETFSLIDIPSKPLGALFDLNWLMVERANGWRVAIQYNTELFEAETISRMLAQFLKVLEEIAANPERRLSDFAVVTDSERSALSAWNDTAKSFAGYKTIHDLLEAQVARTPGAVAVAFGRDQWTYRELSQRSNQLAHYLGRLGVKPGTRVGLCVDRSLEMVAGLLGILKAGASYIPLDPKFPPARLRDILNDSQPKVLLTEKKLRPLFSNLQEPVVLLDSDWAKISRESADASKLNVAGNSIAYVIYTSGTTGKPKGVQVRHSAVVNLLSAMKQKLGIGLDDVLVAVTTLSFDISVLEMFLPLIAGAQVMVASRQEAEDGVRLSALLQRSNATIMQATPATWRMLIDSGWKGSGRLKMLCGGEVLPRNLGDELLATDGQLWNMYGPTETTIWSSVVRVQPGRGPVPIGPPIANTRFYVMDQNQQLVPVGAPGELYIGGVGVAVDYLNQPELTREKFVPDPFSRDAQARLYRTGDMVRWKASGEIEFLGRIDNQLKVRGYRVEGGEVESTLTANPDIREAAVSCFEDKSGSRSLVAYLVAETAARKPSPEELRSFLQRTLPDYMQPSAFVWLESLPHTANGKIDRKRLPSPNTADDSSAKHVPPANATERRMADIWQQVLGVSHISTHANFFDLGGHSLLAAQLLSKVEVAFKKRISLAVLFQSATIQQLSSVILGEISAVVTPGVLPIQPKGTKSPFFCINGWSEMRSLAVELGLDRPFLAVNIPDGKDLTVPYQVEEIAALQIEIIKKIQPEGPYFLGGWCRAGVIAYEIAQQLRLQGEEIGLVVLFESWSPTHLTRYPRAKARQALRSLELWRLRLHLSTLLHMSSGEAVAYARDRWGNFISRVKRAFAHSWYDFRMASATRPTDKPRSKDEIMELATKNYQPKIYEGQVLLFRADEYRTWKYWDPTLGWGDYVPDLEVLEIPGRHESAVFFTGPYAASTGQKIANAIDEASNQTHAAVSHA